MGFVSMSVLFKAVVALQLLVSVYGHLDDSQAENLVKTPPISAPAAAPVAAHPIAAPKPSPHHPPPPPPHVYFPTRKLVAVQGVVYCKSCKYPGSDTLTGASPLSGAVVTLKCHNRKYPIIVDGKTDKNGYFFIQAPKKVSSFGTHKCRVFLASSPLASCKNATNLNGGLSGAYLRYERPTKPIPFALFTVGPFAYGPTKCSGYAPKFLH